MRLAFRAAPLLVVTLATALGPAFSLVAAEPALLPDVTPYDLGEGRKLGDGPAKENSGIVKSRQWPDVYWMENDSGDEPRIYAVRRDGSVYASDRYPDAPGTLIGGAINVDWEDITVDSSGHVIVGDIGNNDNNRRDLVLYYLAEPSPDAGRTTVMRKVFFRYPGQRAFPAPKDDFNYDAEALFTLGDDVYLCTKNRSNTKTHVYRLGPEGDDGVHTLELVDEFDVHGRATAADATPDGRRIVVLTYDALWLFDVVDPNRPLSGPVSYLPYTGGKGDAEAVCFADDETLLVGDESAKRLYEVPLEKFVPFKSQSARRAPGESDPNRRH